MGVLALKAKAEMPQALRNVARVHRCEGQGMSLKSSLEKARPLGRSTIQDIAGEQRGREELSRHVHVSRAWERQYHSKEG